MPFFFLKNAPFLEFLCMFQVWQLCSHFTGSGTGSGDKAWYRVWYRYRIALVGLVPGSVQSLATKPGSGAKFSSGRVLERPTMFTTT